ncbi:MAG: glycine--tRNA ligase, partial [Firmicutes bacterium]|nr:glycine--tRNA ligase [Bacillota bacterium]
NIAGWDNKQLEDYITEQQVACPNCGKSEFTGIRKFNLMFKTFQGVNEDTASTVYLRPETAQGIFVNFANLLRTNRNKMPFGVGQIGKSFRNEITPGNFTFRTREFEQMELEFFCKPGTDLEWFGYWKDFCHNWLLTLGLQTDNLRLRDHAQDELSHYSKATTDFEYKFPFGWGELWGIADRTDFDLNCHNKKSGKDLVYTDAATGEKFVPYVIEPSLGADRVTLAFLCDAYTEETLEGGDIRTVLRLHPALAPFKAAILPLQKDEQLVAKAKEIYKKLSTRFNVAYDESTSIGKRYRRQDEIGTPYCITVDFDTLTTDTVTIRHRDTMKQRRVSIRGLGYSIARRLKF